MQHKVVAEGRHFSELHPSRATPPIIAPDTLDPARKVYKAPMVELLPSILSADFAHLADQVAAAERGGGAAIHVDVMDGHFVPNITLGPPVVKSLRKFTSLPLDCHLMIENPNDYITDFADAGANWVSVHYEACTHLHRSLELIAHHGMRPGVVVNPATRVDFLIDILPMVHHVLIMSVNPGFGGQEFIPFSLDKIRRLAGLRKELGLKFKIEVDGGVAHDTVAQVVQAGAELLVAGNAVFGAGQPERDARSLLAAARKAAKGRKR
jgi:ribulose-phosphate 3-epimerase